MISTTRSMGANEFEVHETDFGSSKSHFKNYPGNNGYVYRRYIGIEEVSKGKTGGTTGGIVPTTYVNPAYKQYP